jgi:hypothetical protein
MSNTDVFFLSHRAATTFVQDVMRDTVLCVDSSVPLHWMSRQSCLPHAPRGRCLREQCEDIALTLSDGDRVQLYTVKHGLYDVWLMRCKGVGGDNALLLSTRERGYPLAYLGWHQTAAGALERAVEALLSSDGSVAHPSVAQVVEQADSHPYEWPC